MIVAADIIRVKVDVDLAQEWANAIVAKLHPEKGGNYTGLEIHNRWVVGMIGQLAAEKTLKRLGIAHRHFVELTGEKGKYPDFRVTWKGRYTRVEVKCRSGLRRDEFMMPTAQPTDADLFVGVRCDEQSGVCDVMGYFYHDELMALHVSNQWHVECFTRHAKFSTMHPMTDFQLYATEGEGQRIVDYE